MNVINKIQSSNYKFSINLFKTKCAFTLSEVLITLVVIGVIATVTIPAVTANYRKKEASAKIKKFYSMLSNAETRAKSDGKDWAYWAESADYSSNSEEGKNFVDEYLLPYLNYYETEQKGSGYYVYFNDGTYFSATKSGCIDFKVDINGDKKPNTTGKDIFYFLYCSYSNIWWMGTEKTGHIIPYVKKDINNRATALKYCKSSNAAYCSGLLWYDNWEFKDDYPYNI